MSSLTKNYLFYTLGFGDVVWPGLDRRNMQVAENELYGLLSFVGPGVLTGWDVTAMAVPTGDAALDRAILAEQAALTSAHAANPDSTLGMQFAALGLVATTTRCRAASTQNLALSGLVTVDGVALAGGDRVLAKDQNDPAQNGVWVAGASSWTRATDLSSPSEFVGGLLYSVTEGASNAGSLWRLAPPSGTMVIGTTGVHWYDAWRQVIRVTPGTGTVGVFAARTSRPYYFRFQSANVYYVWAEASLCLTSEGVASITAPQVPQFDYDSYHTATYLATVNVAETAVGSGIFYVDTVVYEDRRQELLNLAGALQKALKLVFYRHVHLGGADHPSKINLSTQLVLKAVGPSTGVPGTTIFQVVDASGNAFSWDPSAFGLPSVLLNNAPLPASAYVLQPSGGRLFLTNSLEPGATLQVVLPLSPQVTLRLTSSSNLADQPASLTDGQQTYAQNSDGNQTATDRIYTWDSGVYRDPEVRLAGTLVPPSDYSVVPTAGTIQFSPSFLSAHSYQNSDLSVVITHIGDEIQGVLSGRRLAGVDAGLFTKGKVDPRRIVGLDHVGQVRYKEPASLKPHLRLFSQGDHQTFYPEIAGSPLQYGTEVYQMTNSVNVAGAQTLVGSKRGLLQMTDGTDAQTVLSWDPDLGEPSGFQDNLLNAEPGDNHFRELYLRTREGGVFVSRDSAASWSPLRLPLVSTDLGNVAQAATAFWVSTERVETDDNRPGRQYVWSKILYLGTAAGLYRTAIQEGESDSDWTWGAPLGYATGQTNGVVEMMTMNRLTTDAGGTVEHYDRTLYVAADDGLYVDGHRVMAGNVKGALWLTQGASQNDLLWWTDHAAYVTHTAKFERIETSTSTQTFWDHPLTQISSAANADCLAASAGASLPLSGLGTLDGVTLTDGCRVLVKDQADASQNGLYVARSGPWARSADLASSGQAHSGLWVNVAEGTLGGGSAWYLSVPDGFVLGTSPLTWLCAWTLAAQVPGAIQSAAARPGYTHYFLLTDQGPYLIVDPYDSALEKWPPTVVVQMTWDAARQGAARSVLTARNSTGNTETLLIASPRGLWKSNDLGATWGRCVTQFLAAHNPTVYDEETLAPVGGWVKNAAFQSFEFAAPQPIWENLVFERDYQSYYVGPWRGAGADVVVYVNGVPSLVPYALTPDQGLVFFTQGLSPTDRVSITIVRAGAYVSNVGHTPHEELPHQFVVGSAPLTTLSAPNAPTDSVLQVANPTAIPITATLLELRSKTASERVSVTVDPVTRKVSLSVPRQSTVTFPASFTQVFEVAVQNVLGIEDEISIARSGETFHMKSMAGVNVIQASIAARAKYPDLWGNYAGSPPGANSGADRGPKDALFFNFATDPTDSRASSSSLFVGVEPTVQDSPVTPHTDYAIYNASPSGEDMRLGTDQGVWRLTGGRWIKESALGGTTRVFFLGQVGGQLAAGTASGLWRKDGANVWALDPTFPQAMYAHTTGPWNGGTFAAFGKSDGLSFVVSQAGKPGFTSDHYDPLDGKNVYGIWYGQYQTITADADGGNAQIVKHDAIYACSESGLFGLAAGSRGGQFSALLKGREMFGATPLTRTSALPDGTTTTVPVKFYGVFQSPPLPPANKPTIPIIILTNNGVYKVRNWRWCDPTAPEYVAPTDGSAGGPSGGLDFIVEAHSLEGISCQCYATQVHSDTDGTYGKLFIGTSQGVWRSTDEGGSWQRCERIGGNNTPVYSLQFVGSCLLAGTESGLWYSSDDGDTWQRPRSGSGDCVSFSEHVTSAESFGGGYLAETFQPVGGNVQVNKASVYLSVDALADPAAAAASAGNTVHAAIYSVDGQGFPQTLLAASGESVSASQIAFPQFASFDLSCTLPSASGTYALVAWETVAPGGSPVFRWTKSTL